MEEIEKSIRINSLFDRYGNLLSKNQQKMIIMYYQEDLSLGEISEIEEISRNAVYDSIKKGTALLEEYESKLHIIEKEKELNKLIDELENKEADEELLNLICKIRERVNE